MDPKRNPNYMQKAIDKASKLIDLLTKQNKQLKQQNIELQSQYEETVDQLTRLQEQTEQLTTKIKQVEEALQQKDGKFTQATDQIKKLEEKLQEKSNKNKQLYEKLGEYAGKNQEITKAMEKEKRRNLSLQNENEYLLKALSEHETKENQFQNYCDVAESEFKKQMIMVDRTKQAFARKCQELRLENCNMRREIFMLQDKLSQLAPLQLQYAVSCQKIRELEQEITKTGDVLSYIIQSTLRIKPESGLYLRVEQIKNYLNYRLQHIENLIKPVAELVNHGDGKIRDLESLNSLVLRLSTYLGELIK